MPVPAYNNLMSLKHNSFDIHSLDLRFLDAAFLVLGPGGPVLIETGPGSTLPTFERELARFGLTHPMCAMCS